MIKSVLYLFKIHREVVLGNSSVVVQNMLRVTPKSFNAVDMILSTLVDHVFLVFYGMMLAQALERVATSKLVRKVDGAFSRFLSDDSHKLLRRNSFDNPRVYPPIPLRKAENDTFSSR